MGRTWMAAFCALGASTKMIADLQSAGNSMVLENAAPPVGRSVTRRSDGRQV